MQKFNMKINLGILNDLILNWAHPLMSEILEELNPL